MATFAAKNLPYKLAVEAPSGFDVAGIDGDSQRTWQELTPGVPDPVGGNQGVFASDLFYLGGRYYCAFWDNTETTSAVYVYSIAVGDSAWTAEFDSSPSVVGRVAFGFPFDFACDGTNLYLAFLSTTSVTVDAHCPVIPGEAQVGVDAADVLVYQRDSGGTWALLGTAAHETLNRNTNASLLCGVRVCASSADVGNCYVMLSESGTSTGRALECGYVETTWVEGIGASPAIGRVHLLDAVASLAEYNATSYTPAIVESYDVCNDGDQLQVFLQLPAGFTAGERVFDSTISVIKPAASATAVVLTLATFVAGGGFFISPLWTENGGAVRRAVTSRFTSGVMATRTVNDDATVFGHLHNNAALDASDPLFRAGDPAPGFYYDPVADEYWMFSTGTGQLQVGGTTAKCPGLSERWETFLEIFRGDLHTLAAAQGRFASDVFYVLTSTVPGERPKVVSFPVCRACMDCAFA